jgi:hypothetical protein
MTLFIDTFFLLFRDLFKTGQESQFWLRVSLSIKTFWFQPSQQKELAIWDCSCQVNTKILKLLILVSTVETTRFHQQFIYYLHFWFSNHDMKKKIFRVKYFFFRFQSLTKFLTINFFQCQKSQLWNEMNPKLNRNRNRLHSIKIRPIKSKSITLLFVQF